MKYPIASVSAVRRLPRERRQASVNRFAAWQRRPAPPPTPVLTRLIRLLAR
jgi:hypothetical protein